MQVYNIEIFSSKFEYITSYTVSDVPYSFDYLNIDTNTVELVTNAAIMNGDYIHIKGDSFEYFGVVSGVLSGNQKGTLQIEYKSFHSIFDTPILFDTDLQGQGTLENRLKAIIESYWVSNSDSVQNIMGLRVGTTSSTTGWGFNLKSDTEGMHHLICNFYSTFIVRSMQKYGVAIDVKVDFSQKLIFLTIGKIDTDVKYIEAELPNVIEKNITIKESDFDVNKLMIYNALNYTSNIVYYRHTDDSYSTVNADRISPVVQDIVSVEPQEGESFATLAASEANDVFGSIDYNNLIELMVLPDDGLIKPREYKYGQKVIVLDSGNEYNSIYTGSRYEDGLFTMVFGTVRVDLTKILQRRM